MSNGPGMLWLWHTLTCTSKLNLTCHQGSPSSDKIDDALHKFLLFLFLIFFPFSPILFFNCIKSRFRKQKLRLFSSKCRTPLFYTSRWIKNESSERVKSEKGAKQNKKKKSKRHPQNCNPLRFLTFSPLYRNVLTFKTCRIKVPVLFRSSPWFQLF